MNHPVVFFLKRSASNRNLLLLNGLFCMAYPLCYAVVVLFTYRSQVNQSPPATGVLVINLLFLAILILTCNSILVIYRLLQDPKPPRTRLLFFLCFGTWLIYAATAFIFTLFKPGFNTKFHHFVTYEFRFMDWGFFYLLSIFSAGMCYMTWEYYSRRKMKLFACYLIFALLIFSYKMMLPYFLFMMSWIFFAGFHFCIYYELEEKRIARESPVNGTGPALIHTD